MSNGNPLAFTTKYNGRTNILFTPVWIAEAFDAKNQTIKSNFLKYECIWDTGATNSVITSGVVAALGLKPTGQVLCRHAGGESQQNTYLVAIGLPNGVTFSSVKITEGTVTRFAALIGMDIISAGDFVVTNENGITVLSYQYPSVKTIDFVSQIKKKNLNPTSPILSPNQKRKVRNKRKREKKKGR